MTAMTETPAVGASVKIGYSFANVGKSLVWSTTEYLLLFYLTEFLALGPGAAGLLIFLSLALDAMLGPVVGFAADRTVSPFGKYGPYLAFGAPLVGIAFWALFAVGSSPGEGAFAAAAAALLAFRCAYVLCDVPHNALMARIAARGSDAAMISGARFLFSSAGALLAAAGAGAALAAAAAEGSAAPLAHFAAIAGGVYVLALWVAFAATARRDRDLPNLAANVRLRDALGLVVRNRALGGLLALAFVQVVTLPLFAKCLAFWGLHYHGDAAWAGGALALIAAVQAASMGAWFVAARRWPQRRLARIAYLAVGLAGFVFAVSVVAGRDWLAPVALGLYGLGNGWAAAALWALLPAAVAAGRTDFGRAVESLPTGLFLFVIKLGAGVGTALLGIVLGALGLPAEADPAFANRLGLFITTACLASAALCLAATRLKTIPWSRV